MSDNFESQSGSDEEHDSENNSYSNDSIESSDLSTENNTKSDIKTSTENIKVPYSRPSLNHIRNRTKNMFFENF